jgi:basic membrane protein A and related proteins
MTKARKSMTLLSLVALVMLALIPLGSVAAQANQVCLVTNASGQINDGTFNQSAFNGMAHAAEDFNLEFSFIETVAAVDFESNIRTCIEEGADILITVGFPMAEVTLDSALEYPDVYFLGVDQFFMDGPPNLVGLQYREDQMGFAVGVMAALMSESGTIGGVYGMEIPPVVKFRNGYEAGARYADPDINILGTYMPSFEDPAGGGEAALSMIGDGADVIFGGGGPTGSGAIVAAAQAGTKVIGVDQDEYFTTFGGGETPGAENIITSAIKRVDNSVYQMIQAVIESPEDFPGGGIFMSDVTNDGVGVAPPNEADVPEEVTDRVQEVLEGLRDGSLVTGVDPISGAMLPFIPEVAAEAGDFTILLQAVEAAGLAETLAEGGPFTVFAPTDAAFEAALDALGLTAEELLEDTDTLTDILLYHVVDGAVLAAQVVELDGEGVTTLQGGEIAISVTAEGVVLNDAAAVVMTDIQARNGVIHVIDSVLLPE